MAAPRTTEEWLADLRQRQHDQRAELSGLRLLYDQLRGEVDAMRQSVETMATAQQIAREVERRLRRDHDQRRRGILAELSVTEKALGLVILCVQLALLVLALGPR